MKPGDVVKYKDNKGKEHNALVLAADGEMANIVYVSEADGEHGRMPVTVCGLSLKENKEA